MLNLDRLKNLVDALPNRTVPGLRESQLAPTPIFRVSERLVSSIKRITLEDACEIHDQLLVLEQLIGESQPVAAWVSRLGQFDPELQLATLRKAYLVLLALLHDNGRDGSGTDEFGHLLSSVLLGEIKRYFVGRRDMSEIEMLQDLIDMGLSPVAVSLILDRSAESMALHAKSEESAEWLQYLATLKRFIVKLDDELMLSENHYFHAANVLQRLLNELRDEPMSIEALATLVNGVVSKGDQLELWQQLGKSLSYDDRCEIFRDVRPGRASMGMVTHPAALISAGL